MFKVGHKRRSGENPCPVCGFGLDYPPNDFVICPSCGVEFGYETAGRSYYEIRDEWVRSGAHWASRVIPEPLAWNPYLQMLDHNLSYTLPFSYSPTPLPEVIEEVDLVPNWTWTPPSVSQFSIVTR
jgi:hypothetical protein